MNQPDFAALLYALWLVFDAANRFIPFHRKRADVPQHRPA